MIGVSEEGLVAEVLAQQTELPQVIGDVFADVSDGAVGADDDLGIFVCFAFSDLSAGARHHPATLVLALSLKIEDAGLLHQRERRIPEFQMQNLALARQKIVLNVEAQHRFKMAAKNGGGDQLGHFGGFIAAMFNFVECVQANLLARGLFRIGSMLVPLRRAGVEIPAEVIDGRGRSFRALRPLFAFSNKVAHFSQGFLLEMDESDNDVGNLNASVVDVAKKPCDRRDCR